MCLTPSGPHFGALFGNFLLKFRHFLVLTSLFFFLRPLYLTAKLVLTTSTRSSLRYESVAASGLHYIIKTIQNILNILNIQNIPNIPNIQVISQLQISRPGGMREAIRRPSGRRARWRAGSSKFFSPSLASISVFHFFHIFPVLACLLPPP